MKLSPEQIANIQRDCDERARRREASSVDAMLKHSRKRMRQRAEKPIAKHGKETLAKATA